MRRFGFAGSRTLPGRVEKVIPANYEPEKAQISLEGADPLYDEIRVENSLQDEEGKELKLKPGEEVACYTALALWDIQSRLLSFV